MKFADEQARSRDTDKAAGALSTPGLGRRSRWKPYAAIMLVVSAVILPMAFMGIPDGFDLLQHIRFAETYRLAILSGEFIPRWAANDNFGFGSIGIRYYPPLAYYVLALAKIISGSWYHSFWITSFGWLLAGSIGVYLWLKEWTTETRATLASVIYAIAPYHIFQIYQAVLYAEFAASGVLPFCFLFLTRLCRRRRWVDAVLFAIAYSLLILTHIPSALIASLSMAVYGLLIVDWREFGKTAVRMGAALILSGLATAFHLAKALTEVEWVRHNSPQYFANGSYDYKSFFFPIYFSASAASYAQKQLWNLDILIILTIVLLLVGLVGVFSRRSFKSPEAHPSKEDRAQLITGAFSIFMLSIGSAFIWNAVPMLQKMQFPWRWLSVSSLMGTAVFATAAGTLLLNGKKLNRFAAYPIILFVLIIILFDVSQNIIPSAPLSQNTFEQNIENMDGEQGCPCWWPIWAQNGAFNQPDRVTASGRTASVVKWGGDTREIRVEAGEAGVLRVATFFHPYWIATVNNVNVPVGKDPNGAILIPLPTERAEVHLYFREPEFLRAALYLSIFVWAAFAVFLVGCLVWKKGSINA